MAREAVLLLWACGGLAAVGAVGFAWGMWVWRCADDCCPHTEAGE